MEEWKDGGVEGWKDGRMEGSKGGKDGGWKDAWPAFSTNRADCFFVCFQSFKSSSFPSRFPSGSTARQSDERFGL
jgi:hypothetical protein